MGDTDGRRAPLPLLRAAFGIGTALLLGGILAGIYESFTSLGTAPSIRFSNLKEIEQLLADGQTGEAIGRLEMTLELVSLNQDVTHDLLGDALLAEGREDEAIEHYREVVRLRPDLTDAHNTLAVTLARRQRYGESFASFEQLLLIAPDHGSGRQNLGVFVQLLEQEIAGGPSSEEDERILFAARAVLAPEPAGIDPSSRTALRYGRLLSNLFYRGRLETLHRQFTPALAERMDARRLAEYQAKLIRQLGREIGWVGDAIVPEDPTLRYRRVSRFENHPGVVELSLDLADGGAIADLRIRLGDAP